MAIVLPATLPEEPLTDENMTIPHDLWHAFVKCASHRKIAPMHERNLKLNIYFNFKPLAPKVASIF